MCARLSKSDELARLARRMNIYTYLNNDYSYSIYCRLKLRQSHVLMLMTPRDWSCSRYVDITGILPQTCQYIYMRITVHEHTHYRAHE